MAVLANESGSPRDVWTPLGWKHFAVGATIDVELEESIVLELLELGFTESKPAKAVTKPVADAKD